jgi:2-dehydropantoate 2-reductase
MHIAILGAGALGSVIGARLAEAGRSVELLTTNTAHRDAIQDIGLTFETPEGTRRIDIAATPPDAPSRQPDLILLMTKTKDIEAALAAARPMIERGAHVLTLQNGLGNAERVAALVLRARVFYGSTMTNGRMIAPGHVATQGTGTASFTALDPAGLAFAETAALEVPGFSLTFDAEADRILWRKAAFNCALNAICGLTMALVGRVGGTPSARQLAYDVAAEVVALANAEGIPITMDEVRAQMDRALDSHGTHKSSMMQDMEARRPTEIESLCGEVVRRAATHRIPVPLNTALAALVRLRSQVVLAG